jgi:hypothetical protein
MGKINPPSRVRLFVGITYHDENLLKLSVKELEKEFGRVSIRSPSFDFDFTNYYEEEFGSPLKKIFIAFEKGIEAGGLADIKTYTNELELSMGIKNGNKVNRRVNIDPGYLDAGKVILASTKNREHRVYLQKGIYAEITLLLKNGICEPLSWTYPDYRTYLACEFFSVARNP